jgi:hypothetical protein
MIVLAAVAANTARACGATTDDKDKEEEEEEWDSV